MLFSVRYNFVLLLLSGVICSSLLALAFIHSVSVKWPAAYWGLVPALFLFKIDGSKSCPHISPQPVCFTLYGEAHT